MINTQKKYIIHYKKLYYVLWVSKFGEQYQLRSGKNFYLVIDF
jgi:hypothetical protein